MKQKIIYVPDLSIYLGTSEAAIRSHIQRRSWPQAIPEPFRLGQRRWAWIITDVENWISAKTKNHEQLHPAKPKGRPRKGQ